MMSQTSSLTIAIKNGKQPNNSITVEDRRTGASPAGGHCPSPIFIFAPPLDLFLAPRCIFS